MGIISVVLLGILLILGGIFLAWPSAGLTAGFIGVSAVVVGAVILFENVLWPRFGGTRTTRAQGRTTQV